MFDAPAASWALLVVSVLALAAGPLIHKAARGRAAILDGLDGFVVTAIGGLILFHMFPETMSKVGWPAAVALLAGLIGPTLAERHLHRAASQTHTIAVVIGFGALVLHSTMDGVGLAPATCGHGHGEVLQHNTELVAAIILHRLPVGLTIWLLIQPAYGRRAAALTLTAVASATVVGFLLGGELMSALESGPLAIVQAFISGSLLHVILHRHGGDHDEHAEGSCCSSSAPKRRKWALPSGLGALAGVALVVFMPADLAHEQLHAHAAAGGLGLHEGHGHGHGHGVFLHTLLALALESAPALILGYTMAGFVSVFLPHASVRWMSRGRTGSQALRGVAFGLPLPVCSCGVVPLYRSLVLRGVPAAAAMAFLVATPELGLDAVLLSVPLLGGEMTVARVLAAAAVAILVGTLVGRFASRNGAQVSDGEEPFAAPSGTVLERVGRAFGVGYGEVFVSTSPWILLGLIIAAVAAPSLEGGWFAAVPDWVEVPLFALLGMPIYICATGATPLVAVLLVQGVSPGAALAFLLTGPATNVTTFGVLADLHGRVVALVFGAAIAFVSVALGLVVNLVLPAGVAAHAADLHAHDPSLIQWISLVALGVVLAVTVLRVGPRPLLDKLSLGSGSHDHGHDHDHDHGHGHAEGGSCCSSEPAPTTSSCCSSKPAPAKSGGCCGS